jgi:hypothetical protein
MTCQSLSDGLCRIQKHGIVDTNIDYGGLILMSTNTHDFGKLLENMPANLSELARLADVSERSIMRMRDGESVLRGTANKVLRGLSRIYGQTFTLDNVTGINLYDK